jgi:hypothetical protein
MVEIEDERKITVSGWRGDEIKTLDEYIKIWVNHAELSKLWIRGDEKSSELIIKAREKIKALAELNFEYLYKKQNESPS